MEAMNRGYHENKIIWLNPVIEEELSYKREMGNIPTTLMQWQYATSLMEI